MKTGIIILSMAAFGTLTIGFKRGPYPNFPPSTFSFWVIVRDYVIVFSKGPSRRVLDPSKNYMKVVKIRKLQV